MKSQPTKLATTATTMMMATTMAHGPRRALGSSVRGCSRWVVPSWRSHVWFCGVPTFGRCWRASPFLVFFIPDDPTARTLACGSHVRTSRKGSKRHGIGVARPYTGAVTIDSARNAGNIGIVWLSTQDAAKRLGVTPRTLYRFIDEGQLAAYRFGRVIRLQLAEVDDFIERCRIQPGSLEHLYPESVASVGGSADAE